MSDAKLNTLYDLNIRIERGSNYFGGQGSTGGAHLGDIGVLLPSLARDAPGTSPLAAGDVAQLYLGCLFLKLQLEGTEGGVGGDQATKKTLLFLITE